MSFGWIDFSATDRKKMHTVLQNLHEKEVVDELGIAPIRDGFADLFFPGTSTLHTRAKYFVIVPYALKDIEKEALKSQKITKDFISKKLNKIEKECCEKFLELNKEEGGIIGKRAMSQDGWLKRTPADIYLAGIRKYGIIKKDVSLNEFFENLIYLQKERGELKAWGNYQGNADNEAEEDDRDTVISSHNTSLLNISCYRDNWLENLEVELTREEGTFLKNQIVTNCKDSLMAFILSNNIDIKKYDSFSQLEDISSLLPQEMRDFYELALQFSDFWKIPQTIFNLLISGEKNEDAIEKLNELESLLPKYSQIDIDKIMDILKIRHNSYLRMFLIKLKMLMQNHDIEGLKKEILDRESKLKGERAKTKRKGEFEDDSWYGGFGLSYRFGNAKTIINDIIEAGNR